MTAPPMNRSQQGGLQKACHLPEESGPRGGFSLYKAAQVPAQVTAAPSTSASALQVSLPLAGLLQLPTQCSPWGHLAPPSYPALIMAEMA